MANDDRPSELLPFVVLVVLVMVLVGGWWLFPKFQAMIARDDCVAVGHTNCG